jgi:hypothetical protein
MKRKFTLRKTIILAIALALCGSAFSTNASAVGAFQVRGTNVHRSDGAFQWTDNGYGSHRWDRPSSERDLWGHWGSYYGPMI